MTKEELKQEKAIFAHWLSKYAPRAIRSVTFALYNRRNITGTARLAYDHSLPKRRPDKNKLEFVVDIESDRMHLTIEGERFQRRMPSGYWQERSDVLMSMRVHNL